MIPFIYLILMCTFCCCFELITLLSATPLTPLDTKWNVIHPQLGDVVFSVRARITFARSLNEN